MTQPKKKIPGLAELVKNQEVFSKQESDLDREHHGKFALFSNKELIAIVNSIDEGYKKGYAECDGNFSLHEIGSDSHRHCGSGTPYTLEELKEEGLV